MKKFLLTVLVLVMSLCLTGCTNEHSNEIESKFYYGYFDINRYFKNNDVIEIQYFSEDDCLVPHIRFEIEYIHKDKVFMDTYNPDIKFKYLSVQLFLENMLWDKKNLTEPSDENIETVKNSNFWYGYNTHVIKFDDTFDRNLPKGKYRIDIILSVTVDEEEVEIKDEFYFEVVEKNYY